MLGVIHLSDIHITDKNDKVIKKVGKIYDAIKNQLLAADKVIILITGDIANYGYEDQYSIAFEMIEKLKSDLEEYLARSISVIMVPGNHDCDFSNKNKNEVRSIIINQILKEKELKDSTIEICCEVQENFRTFESIFNEDNIYYEDKLLKILEYNICSKKIYFVGINMSWISQKVELPNLFFPLDRYIDKLKSLNGIVITFIHQPSKWSHPNDSNQFDDRLNRYSNIVFLGHEHNSKAYTYTEDSWETIYIKGGALQEHEGTDESEFNIVLFNENELNFRLIKYKFDGQVYVENKINNFSTKLKDNKMEFELSEQHKEFIMDLGANIVKWEGQRLTLNDVFIYPDIEYISNKDIINNVIDKEIIKNSGQFISEENEQYIFITGEEKSGKTSLSKMLYKDYYLKGRVPVLVNGENFNYNFKDDVRKVIEKNFSNQYNKDKLKLFKQLNREQVVIIIDNFISISASHKIRERFIENLMLYYKNIIIISNDNINIKESIESNIESVFGGKFNHYKIKDFGYKMKNKLIHKWNLIGEEESISDEELLEKDDSAMKIINTVFSKNYIPSVPFYILVLLQSIKAGTPNNFNSSSYGYYYEYLIMQSLSKITSQQGEMSAVKTFIVNLAYEMFTNSNKKLDNFAIRKFHINYCENYAISDSFIKFINFDKLLENMVKHNIFKVTYDNKYIFAYEYIYYYCVGIYLAENISEESIKKTISNLVENLYYEEYANILMFIVHHTRDRFVLDEIINKTRSILSDLKCINLDNDLEFVKEVQMKITPLTTKQIDIFKSREETFTSMDSDKEIAVGNVNYKEISIEDDLTLSPMDNINLVFKSMEILGQVLKNYWGKLDKNLKKEIGCELYSVGLRGLAETYKILENSSNELVSRIISEINDEKESIVTKSDLTNKINMIVYGFVVLFTESFFSKIISCVGDNKLSKTYDNIYEEMKCSSVELINLSIKLDYNGKFPRDEVDSFVKKCKPGDIKYILLRIYVQRYLYMYCADRIERQMIIDLFQIDNISQKRILLKNH